MYQSGYFLKKYQKVQLMKKYQNENFLKKVPKYLNNNYVNNYYEYKPLYIHNLS